MGRKQTGEFGNQHWNRRAGRAKTSYISFTEAQLKADSATNEHPEMPGMSAYRCTYCMMWHYGANTKSIEALGYFPLT